MRVSLVSIQENEQAVVFYCTEEDSATLRRTVKAGKEIGDKFLGFCFFKGRPYLLTNEGAYGVIGLQFDEIEINEALASFLLGQDPNVTVPLSLMTPLVQVYSESEIKARMLLSLPSIAALFENLKKPELSQVQFLSRPDLLDSDPDNKIELLTREDSDSLRDSLTELVHLGQIAIGLSRLIILDYLFTPSFALAYYDDIDELEKIIGPFRFSLDQINGDDFKNFMIRSFFELVRMGRYQCLMHDSIEVMKGLNREELRTLIRTLFDSPYADGPMILTGQNPRTQQNFRVRVEGGSYSIFKKDDPSMSVQNSNNHFSAGPRSGN